MKFSVSTDPGRGPESTLPDSGSYRQHFFIPASIKSKAVIRQNMGSLCASVKCSTKTQGAFDKTLLLWPPVPSVSGKDVVVISIRQG